MSRDHPAGEVSHTRSEVLSAEFVLAPTPRWFRGDAARVPWPDYLAPGRRYRTVFRNEMGMVLAQEPKGHN